MNNNTVDDNKSSLERILGPNQASRLFDTLERVLKTNNVQNKSKIENCKSQMNIREASRNEKIGKND